VPVLVIASRKYPAFESEAVVEAVFVSEVVVSAVAGMWASLVLPGVGQRKEQMERVGVGELFQAPLELTVGWPPMCPVDSVRSARRALAYTLTSANVPRLSSRPS
jgi:hypothetical protein